MPPVGSASVRSRNLLPGFILPWLVLSLLFWFGSAAVASAQTVNWTGNASTDWGTAANWDTNAVPASNSTTVVLDTNTGNQAVYAPGTTTVGNITVGNTTASGANTSLTIQGGNLTSGVLYIGKAAGSSGNVLITGAGTQLTANKTDPSVTLSLLQHPNIEVGNNGTGCLTIANGAHVTGLTVVGASTASTGTLLVTGDGTTLNSGNYLYVGLNGTGNATIADGAVLNLWDVILQGNNSNFTATGQSVSGNHTTLNIQTGFYIVGAGNNITLANGSQSVSGGRLEFGGNGDLLTVTDPGTSLVINHDFVTPSIFIGGGGSGSQLVIANGASITLNFTGFTANIGSTGTGGVTVTGNGSLWTITGNLAVGGGTNGTLTLANGGTVSQSGGNITLAANGTLNLNMGGVLQISSSIVSNSTNATFNWAGGVLRAVSNNTVGGSAILSANGGGIVDSNGHNFGYSGILSGAGNFTKNGAGNLTLSGANNYTGATIINQGTLTINDTTHFTGDCIDNANLVLNWGNSSYAGALSGNGNLTISGQLTMTGNNNTFSGNINLPAPITTTNMLTLAGDATQFNCAINFASLGLTKPTLAFNSTTDTTFPGTISGNGFIRIFGTHNLTLSANNALAGFQGDNQAALTIGGPLIFTGDTSNTPFIRIFMPGGGLTFNQPTDSTLNCTIDARGNFTHAGPGTLTVIGRLGTDGNITINSGTLRVSGTFGAGNVVNNGTLILNQNTTFSGVTAMTGTGTFVENGTTVLSLAGNYTYTGPTIINGGTLAIDGNLAAASNVSVNSGGTLAGIGNIAGPVTVNAGGILTPGDGGNGTLTIGSLTFASGATPNFLISSPGHSSSVVVAGALAYGGNLTLNLAATLQTGTYNLFTSASHSGDFASVTLSGLLSGVLTESGGVWSGAYLGFTFSLDMATGQLNITSSFSPGTSATKQVWLAGNFNSTQLADSSISGDTASPAHDGIPNLVKYAFHLNALTDGHAGLPQAVAANGYLTLSFAVPPADVSYTVEDNFNLEAPWGTDGLDIQTSGNTVTARVLLNLAGGTFLHVVISPAP